MDTELRILEKADDPRYRYHAQRVGLPIIFKPGDKGIVHEDESNPKNTVWGSEPWSGTFVKYVTSTSNNDKYVIPENKEQINYNRAARGKSRPSDDYCASGFYLTSDDRLTLI